MTGANIYVNSEDIPYEEDILRNLYVVKSWLRYIEHKKKSPSKEINQVYERSLKELPGSYKLWYNYLKLRRKQTKGQCLGDKIFEDANNAHERALVFMHKMPRMWIDYCKYLVDQKKIMRSRRLFDRALRALPITQHTRIWPLYLKFIKSYDIPEMAVRVYKRYLKLVPEDAEGYVNYLKSVDRLDEAAKKLADIINDEEFISKEGKSKYQLWMDLCEMISKNPTKVTSLKVEPIIRQGIDRFTDQRGQLWNALSDYYIRAGLFERARDIYEEAIATVTTVVDFTQVFDAYSQFEESVISAMMGGVDDVKDLDEEEELELELRLARFEDLIERRPLLLNSVLLRQNPHNVHEWLKRVELFEGRPADIITTFSEAVQTVDPKLATGKPHMLWVAFAKFYEDKGHLKDARTIFEKGLLVEYKAVDDLASVWCEFAEYELRNDAVEDALTVMQRGTTAPAKRAGYFDHHEAVQHRVFRSLKLWSMYADLEESFGTFNTCKAVYDRIVDLRIATPQIIINYGMFLEENRHFEESFKAYEKGIALFKWPNVYDIWNTYLVKFTKRYQGSKLERTRDLFEQCLDGIPAKFAKSIYLLYAKLEEDFGLARHAMAVYDRATRAVQPGDEQFQMFNVYVKRAAEVYGVTYTREIYQRAIEALPEQFSRDICTRFADLERKLGEVDRARALYAYCSQMCDPRVTKEFWDTWKEFEISHGNEDTVREMLRVKRSVQATFNTQVNYMAASMLATSIQTTGTTADLAPGQGMDEMRQLEAQTATFAADAVRPSKDILFVRSEDPEEKEVIKTANPDEIDIDDGSDEDSEEEEALTVNIARKAVPKEVFGSLN